MPDRPEHAKARLRAGGQSTSAPTGAAGTSRRHVLMGLAGAACLPILGRPAFGQEASYERYYEAARQEGEVMIYTVAPPGRIAELAEVFGRRFPGINVRTFSSTAGPLLERFLADAARGAVQADIYQSSDAGTNRVISEDLIEEYTPESAANIPEDYIRLAPYAWPDRQSDFIVIHNIDVVSDEDAQILDSWEGIVDPRWRGRIAIPDPNLVGAWYAGYFMLWKLHGDEWLERLAALDPVIYDSNVPAVASVVSGQNMVALATGSSSATAYSAGAPIRVHWPEPTPLSLAYSMIPRNAPHPNAARLFLEWLLDREGQEAWARAYDITVIHPDVGDLRDYASEPWFTGVRTPYVLDPADLIREGQDGLAAWNRIMRRGG